MCWQCTHFPLASLTTAPGYVIGYLQRITSESQHLVMHIHTDMYTVLEIRGSKKMF